MRCEICDTEIPAGATECPHCGFEVKWMRGDESTQELLDDVNNIEGNMGYSPRRSTYDSTQNIQEKVRCVQSRERDAHKRKRAIVSSSLIIALVTSVGICFLAWYTHNNGQYNVGSDTNSIPRISEEFTAPTLKPNILEAQDLAAVESGSTDFEETRESLRPYLEVLGQDVSDNLVVNVSDEFYNGLGSVMVMGIEGTVIHSANDENKIFAMVWSSNEEVSHDELLELVKKLDSYYRVQAYLTSSDVFSDETYVWADADTSCLVFGWLDGKTLKIRWDLVDDISIYLEDFEPIVTSKPTSAPKNNYQKPSNVKTCAHAGCTLPAVTTGDSIYCSVHSNKCLECGKYIDEDAMYCISCIFDAVSQFG